jgi:hypothetical protein
MSKELGELQDEVAALRAELELTRQRSVTRRRLLTGLAGVTAVSAAVSFVRRQRAPTMANPCSSARGTWQRT